MSTATATTITREDDTSLIQQDDLVNAIRDNRIVQVRWDELDESERRQAYVNMFLANDLY
jgi:orotate phosphoribosyltransferase-like protein